MWPFDVFPGSIKKLHLPVLLVLLTGSTALQAGNIAVRVQDKKGNPVRDAVVYALPITTQVSGPTRQAVVAQRGKQFEPFVSAVETGTAVQFPNEDSVKHHVYSFSPANKFELPLYSGTPSQPIVFNKAGVVTLGCNIHDWMIAYIVVVDTAWFAVSDNAGQAQLRNLVPGSYNVEVWQPRLKSSTVRPHERVTLTAKEAGASLTFELDLKPEFRIRRAPSGERAGYR